MTNPRDIDEAFYEICTPVWYALHGPGFGVKEAFRAGWAAREAAAWRPIGWLVRGGGGPLTPVGDGYNEWQYRHGPDEPYLAWTHQEKMPVYATPPPPGAASPGVPSPPPYKYSWPGDPSPD